MARWQAFSLVMILACSDSDPFPGYCYLLAFNGDLLGQNVKSLIIDYKTGTNNCIDRIFLKRDVSGVIQNSTFTPRFGPSCSIEYGLTNSGTNETFEVSMSDERLWYVKHHYVFEGTPYTDVKNIHRENDRISRIDYRKRDGEYSASFKYSSPNSQNPSSITYKFDGYDVIMQYQYDNNPTPFHSLQELALIFDQFGVNNVVRVTRKTVTTSGQQLGPDVLTNYSYTYNEQLYPTQILRDGVLNTFGYNCQ